MSIMPIMERKMPKMAALVTGCLPRQGCSAEEIEQDLDRVIEILEAEGAVGPVAGCDFEQSVIDVRFSIDGDDSAAVHRTIGNIAEAIDVALEGHITTAMTPADQLACAA